MRSWKGILTGIVLLAWMLSGPVQALGTVLKLDTAGLTQRSEWIVEGRVLEARVQRDARGRVETEFALEVEVDFRGNTGGTVCVFRLPGGVLPDGSGMIVPGMPRVEVGERVLLFLTRAGETGWRMPVGLGQGKYRVVEDEHGARRLERELFDLELLDPLTGQVQPGRDQTADYAALCADIEAVLAAERERDAPREEAARKEGR